MSLDAELAVLRRRLPALLAEAVANHRAPEPAPRLHGAFCVRRRVVSLVQVQIAEQIRADVNSAMKAGDRDRASALRLVLSELQKDAKEGKGDELAVLRRERKRRRESETAYRDAGRDDLAATEAYEADAIEAYLPAELSDEELDGLVSAAIQETGAESPRDMGRAIQHVMSAAGGRADGKRVSGKVKEALVR